MLEMIALGYTYEQILAAYPNLTYLNIFDAAREALDVSRLEPPPKAPVYTYDEVRQQHAKAYMRWTSDEDESLRRMVEGGLTVAQIANRLQRQRSAIRSRIVKLNLVSGLSPLEQSELERISKLDPKEPADDAEVEEPDTGQNGL